MINLLFIHVLVFVSILGLIFSLGLILIVVFVLMLTMYFSSSFLIILFTEGVVVVNGGLKGRFRVKKFY